MLFYFVQSLIRSLCLEMSPASTLLCPSGLVSETTEAGLIKREFHFLSPQLHFHVYSFRAQHVPHSSPFLFLFLLLPFRNTIHLLCWQCFLLFRGSHYMLTCTHPFYNTTHPFPAIFTPADSSTGFTEVCPHDACLLQP